MVDVTTATRLDLARIRAVVLEEARAAAPPAPWWRAALKLIALQLSLALALAAGWAAWFAAQPTIGWPSAVLVAAVIAGSAAALRPRRRWSVAALGIVAGSMAMSALGAVARPHVFTVFGDLDCFLVEIGASIVPAWVVLRMLRRFAFSPRTAGLGGLAAGATGMLALALTCPVGTGTHVLALHLAPAALLAGGVVVARWRSRADAWVP